MTAKRNKKLTLPLNDEEFEQIKKDADGQKMTVYIRGKLGLPTAKIGVPFGKKNALKENKEKPHGRRRNKEAI